MPILPGLLSGQLTEPNTFEDTNAKWIYILCVCMRVFLIYAFNTKILFLDRILMLLC